MRHDKHGAQFGTVDLEMPAAVQRIERQIGAHLQPFDNPVGLFGNAVQRVVGHSAAREVGLSSAGWSEVVVQFDAELAQLVDRGVVDLDLVGLGIGADAK